MISSTLAANLRRLRGQLAGLEVDLRYRDNQAEEVYNAIHKAKQIATDADGAFAFEELIPEMKFELSFRRGKRRFERQMKPAEATVSLKPGECRDVGALKLKLLPEKAEE
jgi:hypothetical protein